MKQLNDIVTQLTDSLKPLQKKLQDEDAKNQEKLRAEEKRKEEEKRIAEEKKKKLEEQKKVEEQKQQENDTAVWRNCQHNYAVGILQVWQFVTLVT